MKRLFANIFIWYIYFGHSLEIRKNTELGLVDWELTDWIEIAKIKVVVFWKLKFKGKK